MYNCYNYSRTLFHFILRFNKISWEFANTTERGDIWGWKQAQRQGKDRVTLHITLLSLAYFLLIEKITLDFGFILKYFKLLVKPYDKLRTRSHRTFARYFSIVHSSGWLLSHHIYSQGNKKHGPLHLLECRSYWCLNFETKKNCVLSQESCTLLCLHPSHNILLQWVGPSLGPKCHAACQIAPSFTKPFVKDTQFFHIKQLAIEDHSVNYSF